MKTVSSTTIKATSIKNIPPGLIEIEAAFSYLNFGYMAPIPTPSPLMEMHNRSVVAADKMEGKGSISIAMFAIKTTPNRTAVTGTNP